MRHGARPTSGEVWRQFQQFLQPPPTAHETISKEGFSRSPSPPPPVVHPRAPEPELRPLVAEGECWLMCLFCRVATEPRCHANPSGSLVKSAVLGSADGLTSINLPLATAVQSAVAAPSKTCGSQGLPMCPHHTSPGPDGWAPGLEHPTHIMPCRLTFEAWPACRPVDRHDNGTTAIRTRFESASAVQPSPHSHASLGHLPPTLP